MNRGNYLFFSFHKLLTPEQSAKQYVGLLLKHFGWCYNNCFSKFCLCPVVHSKSITRLYRPDVSKPIINYSTILTEHTLLDANAYSFFYWTDATNINHAISR